MEIPVYNDGFFKLYNVTDDSGVYPKEKLEYAEMEIWFRELNIYDSRKVQFKANSLKISKKIAIPQYRGISSLNVVKIDDIYYKVFNVTHIKSKDGFLESEITLENARIK